MDNSNSQKTQLQNKLSDTHQRMRISIMEGNWVNLLVLKQLPMREIQRQILSKFESDIDANLELLLIQAETGEPVKESLLASQLAPNTLLKLVPKLKEQEITIQSQKIDILMLREVNSGEAFVISQLPAIIGRQKLNVSQNVSLAVDLGKFGKSVSGIHARLTSDDTNYYIENLTTDNRLIIERDGQSLRVTDTAEEIKNGDMVEVGRVRFSFSIEHT